MQLLYVLAPSMVLTPESFGPGGDGPGGDGPGEDGLDEDSPDGDGTGAWVNIVCLMLVCNVQDLMLIERALN